jgi:hypothetical protein
MAQRYVIPLGTSVQVWHILVINIITVGRLAILGWRKAAARCSLIQPKYKQWSQCSSSMRWRKIHLDVIDVSR